MQLKVSDKGFNALSARLAKVISRTEVVEMQVYKIVEKYTQKMSMTLKSNVMTKANKWAVQLGYNYNGNFYPYEGGLLAESVSHRMGKIDERGVVGWFGYYEEPHFESIWRSSNSRRKAKYIPRPRVGYWLEWGTQPHSISKGDYAPKAATAKSNYRSGKQSSGSLTVKGIPAMAIMDNAFKTHAEAMYSEFDRLIKHTIGN